MSQLHNHWVRCDAQLPAEGVVVLTKIHDKDGIRNEAKLKRHKGKWQYRDESVRCTHVPTHWKHIK